MDEPLTTNSEQGQIAVVTDSTADIPPELAEQLGIQVVANTIVVEGQSLEDGKDLSREDFYTRLPQMKSFPTTATASSGLYQELYERLLGNGYREVLSIHTSSLLSGIINAASAAAQAAGSRVHVIDSGAVSMALGFQVLAAAEAARENAALETVLKRIEDVRRRVRLIAMLDTLEFVRRSGRVSWARARLGELLHVKPFLEVRGGEVHSLGEARTRRKGTQRLLEFLRELGPLERLAVLHSNAEADARQFLAQVDQPVEREPLIINITTVIGAHVGPGALGIAAVSQPASGSPTQE